MRLPAENTLALPPGNELVVDAADSVALTDADVLALLPGWVRASPSRLRDAIVRATRGYWTRVQARIGRALGALQTPRNALGLRLDDHAGMRQRPRAPDEVDAELRERLLVRPERITPNALVNAVTALVLARTPIAPVLFEPGTDGMFVQSADAGEDDWMCFYQRPDGPPLWAYMRDNATRAGVWISAEDDVTKAVFVVLLEGSLRTLPDGLNIEAETMGVDPVVGDFIGGDTGPTAWGFIGSAVPSLEAQVVREVEARRGAGVAWRLYVVPNLRGAL